jgi:Protein of unknown function (DUF3467)
MSKTTKNSKPSPVQSPVTPVLTVEEVAKRTKQVENLETRYFNHARVAGSFMDMRVFFGEQSVTAAGEVTFIERLCVAMSPEFALIFLQLFAAQMAQYENIFGKIRRPPQQSPAIQEAISEAEKKLSRQ